MSFFFQVCDAYTNLMTRHLLHAGKDDILDSKKNVDKYGDSYYEDIHPTELRSVRKTTMILKCAVFVLFANWIFNISL